MRHFVSLLIVLSLAASACGSSTETTADTTTTTLGEESTTTEAETTTTTAAETTTTESTTTTTEAVPEEVSAGDPVVVAYCAATNDVDERLDATDFTDPAALEDALNYQVDTISAMDLPGPIADDISTMISTSTEYLAILREADFDLFAVEADVVALFEQPDVEAAGENIDLFDAEFCPTDVDDEFEPDENPFGLTEADVIALLEDPAGREGIVEGVVSSSSLTTDEATCFIDNTDPTVLAALFSIGVGAETEIDPAVAGGMIAGLDACGLSVSAFG